MAFVKATRKKAKLRLALTGPSGSGKTFGALMIAKGIGGRIACIDTERGSASLYSHLVDFDAQELAPPYSPESYIKAIKEAEAAGYNVLIIDSTTHEWSGIGGCLEINEDIAKAKYRSNTWSAWNETTPRHRKFIDCMLQSNMHIIATGRSKTETAQTEENGRKKVTKLGMKTEQRDGFEYEFTAVLDIVHDGHYAVASKDRTGLFGGDAKQISEETGKRLLAWLDSGVEEVVQPKQGISAPITPTSGAGENLTPEQANKVTDIALSIVELLIEGRDYDAFELLEASGLDADEKVALWRKLDSKQRAAIKKQAAKAKEPA